MYIKIDRFHGMQPQTAQRKLGMYQSVRTHNARLYSHELEPYDAPLPVALPTKATATSPAVLSIFPINGKWLNWLSDVDVQRSPTARDAHERYYFTGAGPMQTTTATLATTPVGPEDYPAVSYDTGMPAPTAAPGLTARVAGETRSYAYRWINEWDEASALSPAQSLSGSLDWRVSMSAPPAGSYNVNGLRYQVFRADAAGTFRFVGETTGQNFNDDVPNTGLGEAAPDVEYLPPAADLRGLVVLPNGFFAAFRANEVWFSAPFQPHAWPEAYRMTCPDTIVSLGVYSTTLVVATDGRPSVVSGLHPANMVEDVLDVNHSCISKRSMVRMRQGVAWATPEGIVYVSGRTAQLVTEPLMERPDWTPYAPGSILATTYDDRYVAFYDRPHNILQAGNTAEKGGFIFDAAEATSSFKHLTTHATAVHFDMATGDTYLVVGNIIHRFDAHRVQMQTYWRSKRFVLPRKSCLTVAKVRWTPNSSLTFEELRVALAAGVQRLNDERLPVKDVAKTSSSPAHREILLYPVLGSPAIELIVRLAQQPPAGVTFRLWADDPRNHGDDELVHAEEPADSELFRISDDYGKRDEYWLEVTGHQADIHEVVVAETPTELAQA